MKMHSLLMWKSLDIFHFYVVSMYQNVTESLQMRMRHHIQHDTADSNILNTVVNSHKGKS